jgi:hypothetical protein
VVLQYTTFREKCRRSLFRLVSTWCHAAEIFFPVAQLFRRVLWTPGIYTLYTPLFDLEICTENENLWITKFLLIIFENVPIIFSVLCLRAFRLYVVSSITHTFLCVDYILGPQSPSHIYFCYVSHKVTASSNLSNTSCPFFCSAIVSVYLYRDYVQPIPWGLSKISLPILFSKYIDIMSLIILSEALRVHQWSLKLQTCSVIWPLITTCVLHR